MESFPVAQPSITLGALQANMEAQQGILSNVGQALSDGVTAALQQQQNLAAKPIGKCCKQILVYIQQQDAILQQTFQSIYTTLQNVLAEQQILVNQTSVYQQTMQGGSGNQGGGLSQSRPQYPGGPQVDRPLPGMPSVPSVPRPQTGGDQSNTPPASQPVQPGQSGFGVTQPREYPSNYGPGIHTSPGTLPSAPYSPYSAPQQPVIQGPAVAVPPPVPPAYTSPNGQTVINLSCPAPVINVTCPQCGGTQAISVSQAQQQEQSQTVNVLDSKPLPLDSGASLCDVTADEFLAQKRAVMMVPYGLSKGYDASPESACGQLLLDDDLTRDFSVGQIIGALGAEDPVAALIGEPLFDTQLDLS